MLLTAKDYNTSKSICHGMPKKCAKIGHAIFGEVLRYVKANLVENVHFRISLRETLEIPRHDAINRQKSLPVTAFLEPAVKMDVFHKTVLNISLPNLENLPIFNSTFLLIYSFMFYSAKSFIAIFKVLS